jgi:hypothetical protein
MQYSDFIKDKKISHNDEICTRMGAFKYLHESNSDIVSYNSCKKLEIFNVAMLEVDKDGNYIYKCSISRESDVIDNIHMVTSNKNVKMNFTLNDWECENINTFITVLASFTVLKLKFVFTEKPRIDDKISIYYKDNILSNDLRNKLLNEKIVLTDTNIYANGTCGIY